MNGLDVQQLDFLTFSGLQAQKSKKAEKSKEDIFVKKRRRRRRRSCLATVEIESDSLLHLGFKLAVAATAAVAIFTEKIFSL